jgi:short-subunit dehydrogenase
MPSIAIVGAGPGMGLAIARTFGSHEFNVALISRDSAKLDGLVDRSLPSTGSCTPTATRPSGVFSV